MKQNKKTQLNIQFLMAFVTFMILVVSTLYFINTQIPKLENNLKEKVLFSKMLSLEQKVFSYSGYPPNWDSTLNNVKIIGYSIRPFIIDFTKIYYNEIIIKNDTKRKKFEELFSKYVNNNKKVDRWIAYYKIKSIDPLDFIKPYGYVKINRTKEYTNISFNLSSIKSNNKYLYFEILSDEKVEINASLNTYKNLEQYKGYYLIKFENNGQERGYFTIKYKKVTNNGVEKIYYPNNLIFRKFECLPIKICENSGFIENNIKIPLIKYFGMYQYKRAYKNFQTFEWIYNSYLKTLFTYYIVEVHLIIW